MNQKKSSLFKLLVLSSFAFYTASSFAAGSCEFFDGANQTGTAKRIDLISPAQTLSPYWYANTSTRYARYNLDSMAFNNKTSSIRIVAEDSDVDAYIFDGDKFDGSRNGMVHCKKGTSCTINLTGSSWDNIASSLMCQRDYSRQVVTGTVLGGPAHGAETSPTMNLRDTFVAGDVKHIVWDTRYKFCLNTGTCTATEQDKYIDMFDVKADGRTYSTSWNTHIWIQPHLDGQTINFYPIRYEWSVNGLFPSQVGDQVKKGVIAAFDSFNATVHQKLQASLPAAGLNYSNFVNNKSRVEIQISDLNQTNSGATYALFDQAHNPSLSMNNDRSPSLQY